MSLMICNSNDLSPASGQIDEVLINIKNLPNVTKSGMYVLVDENLILIGLKFKDFIIWAIDDKSQFINWQMLH